MTANKSRALIVLTLNANMNEPNLHVSVLRKLISLSYILRAKRVVSICSSTTTMHSYLHRQFAEYLLHCISLPGMFDGLKTASKIQTKILFVNISKYQSYNTTYIVMFQNCKQSSILPNCKHSSRKNRVQL